jgi:hypothetical protein
MPAAGEHGVQLLSGFLPGDQAVHGLGGDALGGMDGAGVAQTGRGAHIVKRQPDGQLAAAVPDPEVTPPLMRLPVCRRTLPRRRRRRPNHRPHFP